MHKMYKSLLQISFHVFLHRTFIAIGLPRVQLHSVQMYGAVSSTQLLFVSLLKSADKMQG